MSQNIEKIGQRKWTAWIERICVQVAQRTHLPDKARGSKKCIDGESHKNGAAKMRFLDEVRRLMYVGTDKYRLKKTTSKPIAPLSPKGGSGLEGETPEYYSD